MTIFPKTITTLRERLSDSRSGRVVFLSHCLLNENARYMGGAFCAGMNPEVLDLLKTLDCGVVQMMCPERISWGGVLKKDIYQYHGIGRGRPGLHRLCIAGMPAFMALMNWRMRRVAKYTAGEIQDYIESGMKVLAIIGIRGSPSCAVTSHSDLLQYFDWSSKVDIQTVSAEDQNSILKYVARSGPGVYMKLLLKELKRRRIEIPFYEFDLYDEIDGKPNRALKEAEKGLVAISRT